MLIPKESLKTDSKHIVIHTKTIKVAEKNSISHFEHAMGAHKAQAKKQQSNIENALQHMIGDNCHSQGNGPALSIILTQVKSTTPEPLKGGQWTPVKKTANHTAHTQAYHADSVTAEHKQPLLTQERTKQHHKVNQENAHISTPNTRHSSQLVRHQQVAVPNLTRHNKVQLVVESLSVKTTTNEKRHNHMAPENIPTPNQDMGQSNHTPGNIILANIKTNDPINAHLHTLVSQLVERVQILVANLTNQNTVQLVLDQGKLKGTEITITLQNNQLTITLAHNGQHAELLKKIQPELLERLQKINTDQQVRVVTMNHEPNTQHSNREQGQESSQKSRILDYWLEEQENA